MRVLAPLVGMCTSVMLLVSLAPPALADEIVVDDASVGVVIKGEWAQSASTAGFLGSGYRYRSAGDGSGTVTWPLPASAVAGTYEVSARWTSGPNRASNAPYVVTHAAGSTSVSVDQRTNGGEWQSLGTFSFRPGSDEHVTLSDKADGIVIADAVRWVAATAAPGVSPASYSADARFFEQTRYRIDRDAFWDFFQKRGGLRSFGYPVSREFTLFGCQTQLFQRLAMQQCGDNGVGTLNVLEDGFLPYAHFQGSTVPAPDPALISAAPLPSDPAWGSKAIDFVRANAPETFDGEPVKFFSTFGSTVGLDDAFPQGNGDAGLLPLLNLQLWGLPTSTPAYDPTNNEFIYMRFQRGMMHYDTGCRCTRRLLLADYLKAVLTGNRLPA